MTASGRRPHGEQEEGPRGQLVASVLAGTWRRSPPPWSLSPAALAEVTPLLLRTGVASLSWRRISQSDLPEHSSARQLQQAYRFCTFQAAVGERQVIQILTRLGSAGVDPLLAKGWAAARLYPDRALRPYDDIDLWVRPQQYDAAVAALTSTAGQDFPVHLHQKFRHSDHSWDEVYDRSRVVHLGEVEVRTLGAEDHLCLLCTHMLYHGAWRPLWLCDIGAAMECLPADFDWEYCLAGRPRYSDWVACAIGLAHEVLDARLDNTPAACRDRHLP